MKSNYENKNIIVGITGGIAAYKSISLCSYLVQQGANVYPIMTKSAEKFVTKISLRGITGKDPLIHVDEEIFDNKITHIHLADISDLIVVSPATANFISKHANGLCDDMLSNILLATKDRKKVLFVPAMNVNMYQHPATVRNIETIKEYGIQVMDPAVGRLACSYDDEGKLPDTRDIMRKINTMLICNDFNNENNKEGEDS